MHPGVAAAWPVPGVRAHGRAVAGVRAAALALSSGALYTLAQPPLDRTAVAWICLVPLLWAIGLCRTRRGAAACAFGTAMVFSALVAGWLPGAVSAFFGVAPGLGWGVATAVYVAYAGAPYALFGACAHGLLRAGSPAGILAGIPALLVATDLLRTHVLAGLPWGLLGHALAPATTFVQIADLAGVHGVSFVVALVNAAVVLVVRGRRAPRTTVLPLAVAAAVVAATALYGTARLATVSDVSGPAVRVGVLQPNQAPLYHATPVAADRALLAQLRFSQQHFRRGTVDLVVWPENAIPFYVQQDARTQAMLGRLADAMGAALIVGAPATAGDTRYFNAAHLIVPGRGVAGLYRKQRLVPFAEYQPFAASVGASDGTTFAAGDGAVVFDAAGVQWGPTICLDIIYADVVRRSVQEGAQVLVNLSNDSWLAARGGGAAAQQLVQAVFRAVENRRDLVRATTTGISAVVGADGRVRAVLEERRAGALIAPVYARREHTLYTQVGDAFAVACGLLAALIVGAGVRREG